MRVGVVCEGPTDFLAISHFLRASMKRRGVEAEFVDIQPEVDATSKKSGGGWTIAIAWLIENPPEARRRAYLEQGLFGGGLAAKKCDVLLIQIDADVLGDESFRNYVQKNIGWLPAIATTAQCSFDEVARVLLHFSGYTDSAAAVADRNVIAPVVQNTETWCVAVRAPDVSNLELLDKAVVATMYEQRLEEFEGRAPLKRQLKNRNRRDAYCRGHLEFVERLELSCGQYVRLINLLL